MNKSARILPLIVICLLIALRIATIPVKARTLVMTIVMLPDNQYYSEAVNGGTQAMNLSQVSYAQSLPADVIVSVGDNYNWTGNSTDNTNVPAWSNALLATGIPWISSPGNHDYQYAGGNLDDNRTLTNWNTNVGAKFATQTQYQASYPGTGGPKYENSWIDIGVHGTHHWAVLTLGYCPSTNSLTWAAGILAANPTFKFIIATHSYVANTGVLDTGSIGTSTCFSNGLRTSYNTGVDLWNNFISLHDDQIELVLSGHFNPGSLTGSTGASQHRTDTGTHGIPVNEVYTDYQQTGNGGNGYLKIFKLYDDNTMDVTTYSPVLSASLTDSYNQFTITLGLDNICGDPAATSPNFPGTYGSGDLPLSIGFNSPTSGCNMFYTSDGSTPTCASTAYPGGFTLSSAGTYTYKVIACQGGFTNSSVTTATWIVNSGTTYSFSATISGVGSGNLTSDTGNCVTGSYPSGTVIDCTATATGGSTFAGWTGACTGTSLFCSVTLTSNQTLNAEFDPGSLGSTSSGQSISTGSAVIQ